MRMPAYPSQENPWAEEKSSSTASSPSVGGGGGALDIDVQALAQQAMQRPQFTIDEATEADGEDFGGEGDEALLGQVDAMLQADDAEGKGESIHCFPRQLSSRLVDNPLTRLFDCQEETRFCCKRHRFSYFCKRYSFCLILPASSLLVSVDSHFKRVDPSLSRSKLPFVGDEVGSSESLTSQARARSRLFSRSAD